MFRSKRYIQYYDNHCMQLLGSDSVWVFDQRWSNTTALAKAYEKVQNQARAYLSDTSKYVKPRQCYAAVLCNESLVAGVPATLENPLYPETY